MGRFSLARGAAPKPEPAPAPTEVVPEPRATTPAPKAEPKPTAAAAKPDHLDMRLRLHARLIDELDLSKLDKLGEAELKREVMRLVADFARGERMALNSAELEALGASIYDEMVGLGPIEPLLKDDSINDILINGPFQVYVERRGELELTPIRFRDNDHLLRIVNRIVAGVGRRIDESQPMVDARLPDGSRVNAAIAPIAIDGAAVSIRKFSKKP
ncbi:MAG: cpaF, partial [Phenylobacterium sp.]|nr:cpaF [Phenylobacterium sp.]